MDLVRNSFHSVAASMQAVGAGSVIDTLTAAHAAAMGPQLKDLCEPSIAERLNELTGMKQIREIMRQHDQLSNLASRGFACDQGQAVFEELALQNDFSQIVDRCLSQTHLQDFDPVGGMAAMANTPWFEASDMLRQQAEAWSAAGERGAGAAIRSALGADAASQAACVLEREMRAWDAWADRWRDPLQDVISQASASDALAALDFVNAGSQVDLQAMFGPSVDATRMISDAIGQLGVLGYAAYQEQARRAFEDVLNPVVCPWVDGSFQSEWFQRPERMLNAFQPTPGVTDESPAEKRARLSKFLAFVWRRLRSKKVSGFTAMLVAGTLANMLGIHYNLWLNPPATQPTTLAHAATSAPAQVIQLNVESAIVVDVSTLAIRQSPNAKARMLASAGYGHVLRVLKPGAKNWALVEYVDPVHPGVRITGWGNTTHTRRVDAETLRLLWCGMIEKPTELGPCRLN